MANVLADRVSRRAPDVELPGRHFHTWLPRQLVTFGLFGALIMPVALYFLDDDEHIEFAKGRLVVDSVGHESLRVVFVVGLGSALVGWLLWTIAAAFNARGKSRWSISPLSVPMAYVFIAGLAIGAAAFTENFTNKYTTGAIVIVSSVAVISHLGVLAAFRRAAVAISAPDAPWSRMMMLPCAIGLITGFGAFFTEAVATRASYLAISGFIYLLMLLMAWSWVRAMVSFDRACVGTHMTHESMEIPAFLRGNQSLLG